LTLVLVLLGGAAAFSADIEAPATPGADSIEGMKGLFHIEVPTVSTASRYEQSSTEAPAIVTVVTEEEVKRYGYRTLADILRSVPSLDVTYDRNYDYLGVRGFNRLDNNNRVLLLVDGHRVNNSLTDGAYIDTAFILDTALIKRVEVISGPGSVLYGNNAMFGVINVFTRHGGDIQGVEASGWGGSQETGQGRITIGEKLTNGMLDGLEFLVSGSIYESSGEKNLFYKEFNSPDFNNGIAENGDSDEYKSAFTSLSYHEIISLEGGYIWREKGNPTAPLAVTNTADPGYAFGAAFNDPRTQTTDQRAYAALKFAYEIPWEVKLTANLYYDWSDFDGANVFYNPRPAVDVFHNLQTAQWWGAELQADKVFLDRYRFTLGGEYRDDFIQHQETVDEAAGTVPDSVHDRTRQSYGFYAEGDAGLLASTNLHINAGVRFDKYGDFSGTANPRVALIYSPLEQSTFKAIYGTAFRVPNFFEITLESPSLGLGPEKIKTYELAFEQGIGAHFRGSVAGFYNDMKDLISLEPDPSGGQSYQNIQGADAKGVEFALQGNWGGPEGILGRLSYTLQKTRDKSTDEVLTDSPENLVKFNLSVPLWKNKIYASAEFQYTDDRKTFAGTEAGDFGVLNLTLFSRNLVKGLELSVSVYNVFDRHYSDPATPFHVQDVIPQDGRLVYGKLTYRF
jgi:iron complex outermembrane receptor protein